MYSFVETSITEADGGLAGVTYDTEPKTITVTVTDKSCDGDLFEASVSASLDGNGTSAPKVSGWSHSGDRHYAEIFFGADGDYSFTLNVTDLAGNEAEGEIPE